LWAQNRCGSNELWEAREQQNPSLSEKKQSIESQIQTWIANKAQEGAVVNYNIPVVFHVLYKNETENVSDEQILSQLTVLNEDFRRTNLDAINTESDFLSVATDCEINFCLAQRTSDNTPTTGITRTATSITSFSLYDDRVFSTTEGGEDIWNSNQYLNIYICDLTTVLGFSSFPGGNNNTDGVVIDFENFGTIGTAVNPYHKGRTATHEVGHWLNLYHIWGDNNCGDDLVSDTPLQETENYGCPAHPQITCDNEGDMFQNYMDYSNDACMNLFTTGQKDRMHATLSTTRLELLQSKGCSAPYEDAGIYTNIAPEVGGVVCGDEMVIETLLQNFSAENLNSVDIVFQLDSDTPQTYNWTGNLSPGNSQNISVGTIGLSEGNHTLLIHTTNPDGASDINTTNDTIFFNFTSIDGQAYNITVVPDNYGEEVSWDITDYSGMAVASEDDLTSNEANNAELCLLSDSCYTFTIYDEYDDGICCDYGNGYFSINNQVFDGAYGEEMSIDLCELSGLTEIITANNLIYPNPTTGMIWIETTENTIQNITVYNYLGEIVKSLRPYSSNQAVDLSSLQNGIYLLEMKNTNNQSIVQKVILHK
jgi:hypothetical protein